MSFFDSAKKISGIFNKEKDEELEHIQEEELIEKENENKSKNEIMDSLKSEKQIVLDLPMYDGEWHNQSNVEKNKSTEILDMMKSIPLFSGIKDGQLKKLIPLFYRRHFSANEYLFRQGNPGSCMFIIKNGKVSIQKVSEYTEKGRLVDKETIVLAELSNGKMFGEMSLINNTTRSTDALCIADTDVFVLFKYDLEDLFRKEPGLGYTFYTKINEENAQRLAITNTKLETVQMENRKLSAYINYIYDCQKRNPEEKIHLYSKDEVMSKVTFGE